MNGKRKSKRLGEKKLTGKKLYVMRSEFSESEAAARWFKLSPAEQDEYNKQAEEINSDGNADHISKAVKTKQGDKSSKSAKKKKTKSKSGGKRQTNVSITLKNKKVVRESGDLINEQSLEDGQSNADAENNDEQSFEDAKSNEDDGEEFLLDSSGDENDNQESVDLRNDQSFEDAKSNVDGGGEEYQI